VAQDPATAEAREMPEAAIAANAVDEKMKLPEIVESLNELSITKPAKFASRRRASA